MGTSKRRIATVRLQALRNEAGLDAGVAPKPLSHYFAGGKPKQASKAKPGAVEPDRV